MINLESTTNIKMKIYHGFWVLWFCFLSSPCFLPLLTYSALFLIRFSRTTLIYHAVYWVWSSWYLISWEEDRGKLGLFITFLFLSWRPFCLAREEVWVLLMPCWAISDSLTLIVYITLIKTLKSHMHNFILAASCFFIFRWFYLILKVLWMLLKLFSSIIRRANLKS